jgi:hypothetical protein
MPNAKYCSGTGRFTLRRKKAMNKMRGSLLCVALAVFVLLGVSGALGGRANAQEKTEGAAHKIVRFGDLKWTPIIKGCDIAGVSGDMNAEGQPFVLRLRCADGSKVQAHWHPTDENVTVLRGVFLVGMGDKFDETKLQTMNVGNFITMPKEMRHFAKSKGDTIVQVHGMGPFKVNWVNPAEVEPPAGAKE